MDQVKIRAVVAAAGLRKHQEVTVAATPMVEGAIRNGVFLELNRFPSALVEEITPPDDETPVPSIETVELPDPPKPKAPRQRG